MSYKNQGDQDHPPKKRRPTGKDFPDFFMPAMPPVESLERFSAWLHSETPRAALRRVAGKLGIRWRGQSKPTARH